MAGDSAEPPVQRLAISVEQKSQKPRFTPIAAAGPCGPALLCGLVVLFLFTTLGASGVAGVFMSRFLGIEDQVCACDEHSFKLCGETRASACTMKSAYAHFLYMQNTSMRPS